MVGANRVIRSFQLLLELFDDARGFGLELSRVFTILRADEPAGITNTFLELVVLDRARGLFQPLRSVPLVRPGVGRQPVDLALQVGDFIVHRFLAFK